jgi:hypothetical protein
LTKSNFAYTNPLGSNVISNLPATLFQGFGSWFNTEDSLTGSVSFSANLDLLVVDKNICQIKFTDFAMPAIIEEDVKQYHSFDDDMPELAVEPETISITSDCSTAPRFKLKVESSY